MKKKLNTIRTLCIAAIVLSVAAIGGEIFIYASQRENPEVLHQKAIRAGYHIYSPTIPERVDFCGERVPIETFYVRESLDRELTANMYMQSSMLNYIKRAARCFPTIERILKEEGVPEDFKYLCVAESGLANVTSPAKASGYWQFMKATGVSYGLEINDEVDMRWDLEASTAAACKYLKAAYRRFGSWTAAAASYNCGEGGLESRMKKQEAASYYDTRLNTETTRYVYRIVAIKTIMQNPQAYGFHVRKCEQFPEIPCTTVELKGQNVDIYQFCKDHGVTYKMLRELNPWLQTDRLTNKGNKTYKVKIPTAEGRTMRCKGDDTVNRI